MEEVLTTALVVTGFPENVSKSGKALSEKIVKRLKLHGKVAKVVKLLLDGLFMGVLLALFVSLLMLTLLIVEGDISFLKPLLRQLLLVMLGCIVSGAVSGLFVGILSLISKDKK